MAGLVDAALARVGHRVAGEAEVEDLRRAFVRVHTVVRARTRPAAAGGGFLARGSPRPWRARGLRRFAGAGLPCMPLRWLPVPSDRWHGG
ncbi:hypothetical protein GCM10009675_50350 [Prauserella alba]|uniref:Uncharacterized protein n=1 Tax=Prauserella alba TaxID=176898 RepID=A0ABN1VS69_9PSEU